MRKEREGLRYGTSSGSFKVTDLACKSATYVENGNHDGSECLIDGH